MDALFIFWMVEMELRSGLIQNYGAYHSYFTEGPYRLALAYPDYSLYAESEGFTMNDAIKSQEEVVQGGFRYRKQKIAGGYLLFQDDIQSILSLRSELLNKQNELSKTTAYLTHKERVEQELAHLEERSKLSAALFEEIEQESGTIERLVNVLPDTLSPEERPQEEPILLELQSRLAFLKQRCLFLVNASADGRLLYEDFALSEGSLLRDVSNGGFNVALSYPPFKEIPLEEALRLNGFFRNLIRLFGQDPGDLFLSFDPQSFRINARLQSKKPLDFSSFPPEIEIEEEEGEYLLRWEEKA
jgi:hypothetical protein